MSPLPWYQQFFGPDYFRIYAGFSPEGAARQVEQIVERLEPPAGARGFDLCCGHGRASIPLAARGYRVTGLDLSEHFLERARADAAAAGVEVEWVRADMRD